METKLTTQDARQSLTAHVEMKGLEIRKKHGPQIGWDQLLCMLEDRTVCRYPCTVVFDAAPLRPGECAYPAPNGERPESGFTLCVHPHFATRPKLAVYLVLYQLVQVNYGDFVSSEDAEIFGASALGLSKEAYYQALCEMADEITESEKAGCKCH